MNKQVEEIYLVIGGVLIYARQPMGFLVQDIANRTSLSPERVKQVLEQAEELFISKVAQTPG